MVKKKQIRNKQYPETETMIYVDNPDDLVLLANTPAQTEPLQRSLEQAAEDLYLYVDANKTKFMF